MEFGQQKVAGAIVSARLIAGDKDRAEREQLTLLMDSGELRTVDLAAATAIRFADQKLQLQFKDYLAALTGARSKDKRSVYIDSTDSKSRDVQAAYIMPMPAWKSSYRLLFEDGGAQPTLEGWAIVDNTTGEDWTNVRLSLVSGKPISFISQLYPPKFITRRGAELAEDQAVAPTVYSGAVREQDAKVLPNVLRAGGNAAMGTLGGVGGGSGGGFGGGVFKSSAGFSAAEFSTVGQSGPAQEIADLFEYDIATPVTVRKDESAMMPFLQQKVSARKLIIYSDASRPNPFSAAELTNNTGKTLDGGPITVFDAGTYAGEALVETVKNADKRFINYGVDLGTRIATNQDSRNDTVRELHAHNGILVSKASQVQKKTYSVHNVDPRAKTLIIEHPVRAGYSLIDTAKPIETARDVYRFEIKLPANGSLGFSRDRRACLRYADIGFVGEPRRPADIYPQQEHQRRRAAQLQQVADVKTQIANTESDKRSVTDQINSVTRDEERNRQNIASLSPVSGQQQLVQDYARKLSEQETQITALRDRESALDRQRASLQTQLNSLIEKLDF